MFRSSATQFVSDVRRRQFRSGLRKDKIMKTIKVISLVMLALLLTLGVYGIQQALAIEPGLYEVAGNPSCSSLYEAK